MGYYVNSYDTAETITREHYANQDGLKLNQALVYLKNIETPEEQPLPFSNIFLGTNMITRV